jgi:hypothetical protein
MNNQQGKLPLQNKHPWRYLFILIVLGLAVHLLLPQITSLEHSWSVVKELTWWAIAAAAAAQVVSYLGNGYLLHSIIKLNREELSIARGALISAASQSIGLVAGGWLGGAAATYGWVHRSVRDNNTAVMAGTLPSMLNNFVLIGIALIGTTYLMFVRDLSKVQLIDFGIILLVLIVITGGIFLGLHKPSFIKRLAVWTGSRWAKLRHRSFESGEIESRVDDFINSWHILSHGQWLHPLFGSMVNIGFDLLTLNFIFIAAGHNVSPEILLAGYGLPLLLGKMAFLFPGGVGVIEGSMVAVYTSLQVPNGISVVVILGYRLISFWLPTLLGFIAAAYLGKTQPKIDGTQ